MVLELNSGVLSANSEVFAGLIADYKKGSGLESAEGGSKMCRMEVPEVENLGVFRDTIELMFEEDDDNVVKRLKNIGVFRSIDILEVPSYFNFSFSFSISYLYSVLDFVISVFCLGPGFPAFKKSLNALCINA